MIYTLTPLACEYRINYSNQLGQVGVAVASAASNIVPAGGVDAHIEQSAGQLATDASRSTAALATKLMEDGIDTATRAVERSIVATVPLVQSAEELSAQYVVPLGDRIAGSKTINDAIDAAATTIESGFQRAQGPVARLEGLVLHYVAAPLDKRLGQFSAGLARRPSAPPATSGTASARAGAERRSLRRKKRRRRRRRRRRRTSRPTLASSLPSACRRQRRFRRCRTRRASFEAVVAPAASLRRQAAAAAGVPVRQLAAAAAARPGAG